MMIDWSNEDWAYLLGVVHGDGNIAPRSICISVGYKDSDYADYLVSVIEGLGFVPKIYRPRSALRIDIHNAELRGALAPFKANGIWSLPEQLNGGAWLAGVFDADGTVTMASSKCAVIIGLKRSGNLQLVARRMAEIGIGNVNVYDRVSKFNGQEYLIEELRLTSFEKILKFNELAPLRHPRKVSRMHDVIEHIRKAQAVIPLWKQVGLWLEGEPRTWEEIATHFSLTKDQVDSVMQNLRRHAKVEVIPPPKTLHRYRVSGLSSSQKE